jgi:bilirubin oxidase
MRIIHAILCGVYLCFALAQPSPALSQSAITPSTTSAKRSFQELYIPPTLSGKSFELSLGKSSKSFWPGATTKTYGFNGEKLWGPTLIFNQGDTVELHVNNALDEPTTVHWHGFHIPAVMDGGPHQSIAAGGKWSPSFQVMNNAGTFWYHTHPHGATQKQLTMGAGGLIIIRDPVEAKLALPRTYGVDDIPLVLTSRRFYKNDQFSYEGDNDKYGDFQLVNGTLDPQTSLPAQFVRLRILNAEIERGYVLGFSDNRTYYVIATDGGLVDKPIPVKRLKLMVGERVELLVDLSKDVPGAHFNLMAYNARQPFGFPGGEPGRNRPNGSYLNNLDYRLLRINVTKQTEKSVAQAIIKLPAVLTHNRYLTEADATQHRTIHIDRSGPPNAEFAFDKNYFSMSQMNFAVKLGDVEAWTIVNDRTFGHSFHIHDVQFKIVSRSDGPVADYEQGWKDTVYVPRGQSVTFVARFDDFASDTNPFMYHCHMSNHEDGGLMGQFLVSKDPTALNRDKSGNIVFDDEHSLTPEMVLSAQRQAQTMAPDFQAVDAAGHSLDMRSLTAAKPLVLFFIERECPCARDAAPLLERLQAAYAEQCNFVGVIDADAEASRQWAKEVGVHLTIVPDPQQNIIKAYGASRAVYTTLIAPGGKIMKTYPGYSAATLSEIAATIAQLTRLEPRTLKLDDAPGKLVVGCPFPKP